MTILRDVLAELYAMFMGDARQSLAILAVVAAAALTIGAAGAPPLAGGAVLLAGALAVLVAGVARSARRR